MKAKPSTALVLEPGRTLTLGSAPKGAPTEIRILSQRWRVVYASAGLSEYGLCWPRQHLIAVSLDQDPESMADTLTHEILHAIVSTVHPDPGDEEKLVTTLTPALLDVLRSNGRWW